MRSWHKVRRGIVRPCRFFFGEDFEEITFAEMSTRSNQVANSLRARGVRRGDRVLLMQGNVAPLWENDVRGHKAWGGDRTLHLVADGRRSDRAGRARSHPAPDHTDIHPCETLFTKDLP
jgi:acyl-CoA synthetase (AMP-forming)/AMP-acid ligase II